MRLVIQRVKTAAVTVLGEARRSMGEGLVILFGVSKQDEGCADGRMIEKLAAKTANLRIFSDADGRMNRSAAECGFSAMVVSNFTLFADTRKGNRPSFVAAAEPAFAERLYDRYVERLRQYPFGALLTGRFGAMMSVEIENDGPVTVIVDTKEWTG